MVGCACQHGRAYLFRAGIDPHQVGGCCFGTLAMQGEFVDGGVSTANNPALQLVLMATVKGYGFGWQMGDDRLSVTSVGTGRASSELGLSAGVGSLAALHAVKALKAVLEDCAALVEVVMQWMSHSPTARAIDREIGTLEGSHAGTGPCLSYLRYNTHFEPEWFSKNLEMPMSRELLVDLAKMDKPGNVSQLDQIGQLTAERFVRGSSAAGIARTFCRQFCKPLPAWTVKALPTCILAGLSGEMH